MLDKRYTNPNWQEQFKIRIANADKSFEKHEIVKTLLVMKLIQKYKKDKIHLRVYTEFFVENSNRKTDVYFENLKTKEVYAYEIQKEVSPSWLSKLNEDYSKVNIPFMKFTWEVIKLKDLPDDINELSKELEKLIY